MGTLFSVLDDSTIWILCRAYIESGCMGRKTRVKIDISQFGSAQSDPCRLTFFFYIHGYSLLQYTFCYNIRSNCHLMVWLKNSRRCGRDVAICGNRIANISLCWAVYGYHIERSIFTALDSTIQETTTIPWPMQHMFASCALAALFVVVVVLYNSSSSISIYITIIIYTTSYPVILAFWYAVKMLCKLMESIKDVALDTFSFEKVTIFRL